MKQNVWLFSIKVLLLSAVLLFCIISCNKRETKVDVLVYNATTGQGIEGISLFYDDETYITDLDGKVEIKKRRNIRDDVVSTETSIQNYIPPDYLNTCQVKNTFKIEGNELKIPFLKLKMLKLRVVKKNWVDFDVETICVISDPIINCSDDDFPERIRIRNGVMDEPLRVKDGTILFGVVASEDGTRIKLFRNEDCSNEKGGLDKTYSIPTISKKDTIEYTIYL